MLYRCPIIDVVWGIISSKGHCLNDNVEAPNVDFHKDDLSLVQWTMNNIVLEVADVVEDEVIVCPTCQCRPMRVLNNVEDGMA